MKPVEELKRRAPYEAKNMFLQRQVSHLAKERDTLKEALRLACVDVVLNSGSCLVTGGCDNSCSGLCYKVGAQTECHIAHYIDEAKNLSGNSAAKDTKTHSGVKERG